MKLLVFNFTFYKQRHEPNFSSPSFVQKIRQTYFFNIDSVTDKSNNLNTVSMSWLKINGNAGETSHSPNVPELGPRDQIHVGILFRTPYLLIRS